MLWLKVEGALVEAYNRLTFNCLTFNQLTFNPLTFNPLTFNPLTFNPLTFNNRMPELDSNQPLRDSESRRLANRPSGI
ncbi:hypothetical protein BJP34_11975 [Moorena producens PAL-8-15-08-1]|uniref:Uncharacterized protein n=1 Tax=Moorena producens PAL-8-15-08-1 TaxID=1458985 RepID=A0A1D8TR73_9CYAN|nr:hypothetical protein BJP34_11975 [Moorena producens PAL-8-15-08-1]